MAHTRTRQVDLTGTADEIGAQLRRLADQPRTVGIRHARRVEQLGHGRAVLPVVVVETARPPWRHPAVLATGATAAVGTLGGVAWVVVTAVTWVADHVALLVGLGVVLLGAYALAVRATGCPGLHCLGCSGH